MLHAYLMTEDHLSPVHAMPSGLCEDTAGDATALIARMAQGDRRAIEEIFACWGPVFLGISQRMFGNRKEAEKAVSDTFVRMWRRSADYDPHKSPPFVWAFTILRDLCIARLHGQNKSRRIPQRAPSIPARHTATEDPRVMPPDDWQRLGNALNSLSAEELGCLESAVFLGYARSSVPGPSDTPSATVKTCLRRALDKIRNQLSRYEL